MYELLRDGSVQAFDSGTVYEVVLAFHAAYNYDFPAPDAQEVAYEDVHRAFPMSIDVVESNKQRQVDVVTITIVADCRIWSKSLTSATETGRWLR
jgi:hypothetical protein